MFLRFPIDKKSFDRVMAKKEDEECLVFFEMSSGWMKRFTAADLLNFSNLPTEVEVVACLQTGSGDNLSSVMAKVTLFIGKGKEVYGTNPEKSYYVLNILEVWRF